MTAVRSRRPLHEEVLERGLSRTLGRAVAILQAPSRPVKAYSCHPISTLDVTLTSGEELAVVFKRMEPAPGKDLRREALVYRRILAGGRFGAPLLYASLLDPARGRFWLFLEDVGGWRLDWCEAERWPDAFGWLAGVHAAYEGRARALATVAFLPRHGPAHYRRLARDARRSLAQRGEQRALARLDRLLARLDPSIDDLARDPQTLVHGDLSGKNILVQRRAIRPIDWEWAARGPAAWDVGKLLSGWGPEKPRLLGVYLDERERRGAPVDRERLQRSLGHCEVFRALWYLRWWSEPCRDPGFVDELLAGAIRVQRRLAAGGTCG